MLGGYAGKVLFVDLTKGAIKEEIVPEKTNRDFIGGYGLGIRILYERMKPKIISKTLIKPLIKIPALKSA